MDKIFPLVSNMFRTSHGAFKLETGGPNIRRNHVQLLTQRDDIGLTASQFSQLEAAVAAVRASLDEQAKPDTFVFEVTVKPAVGVVLVDDVIDALTDDIAGEVSARETDRR